MTPGWRAAVNQALLLQQQPSLKDAFSRAPLPDGMTLLIRLASDESDRRKDLAQLLNISDAELKTAAANYLLSVCFSQDSSDSRVLGLNPGATFTVAKEHHRLLLKWLHPDRNANNKAMAERVNQAWAAIKPNLADHHPAAAPQPGLAVSQPTAGKFPMFLMGLIISVLFFAVWAAMPDNDIYIDGPDSAKGMINSRNRNAMQEAGDRGIQSDVAALKAKLHTLALRAMADNATNEEQRANAEVEMVSPEISKMPAPAQKADGASDTSRIAHVRSSNVVLNAAAIRVAEPRHAGTDAASTLAAPAAQATMPPLDGAGGQIQIEDAKSSLQDFQRYYQQGDIALFMRLFSADARNNRGGREALEHDYAALFEESVQRKIGFSQVRWQQSNAMLIMDARYSAKVKRHGRLLGSDYDGSIQLVFTKHDGHIYIQQILLDTR